MPVGQESPWRGMGGCAVADTAISRVKQSRYLIMVNSPGCRLGSICKVEKFWSGDKKFREYAHWHSAKTAETRFWQFRYYTSGSSRIIDDIACNKME